MLRTLGLLWCDALWNVHAVFCSVGGVKLHAELAFLLGSAADAVFSAGARFYGAVGPALLNVAISVVAAMSACLGLMAALAALSDVLALLLWPPGVLYFALAKLWQLQLTYLGVTWRLMRGNHKVWRCAGAGAMGLAAQHATWERGALQGTGSRVHRCNLGT